MQVDRSFTGSGWRAEAGRVLAWRTWLVCLVATMMLSGRCTAGPLNVLYAGSLVNVMERTIGPAFAQKSGQSFQGYAGGSNKLANEIKSKLRRGDIFISANPKVNDSLMGPANGDWVQWYVVFAESPLVIGYNESSRFAAVLKSKPWFEALAEPGLKLGRTDPKLDPKGAFTLELLKRAEAFYHQPQLSERLLGAPDNPSQVLPEETLVGRLQSGQLDAGFFYSTETVETKIAAIKLPDEITPRARYSVTVLRDAPDPAAAEQFILFLLSSEARALLLQQGLQLLKPSLIGEAAAPAAVRSATGGNP